jgi:hypothetical protein
MRTLAILFALSAIACGHTLTGTAAIATKAALATLDARCIAFAGRYNREIKPRTSAAIESCRGKGPGFRACVKAEKASFEDALAACELYEQARKGAAKALDGDVAGLADEALAVLDTIDRLAEVK